MRGSHESVYCYIKEVGPSIYKLVELWHDSSYGVITREGANWANFGVVQMQA